jgi:hypothetical protein
MEEVKTKKCACCGEVKSATEFSRSKQNKDGLHSYCKPCNHARIKAYYEANPNKRKESARKSYEKNGKAYYEKNKDKVKAYYEENKEVLLAKQKQWRLDNPEKTKEHSKRSYEKNKDKVAARMVDYYQKNKERISVYAKGWTQNNKHRRAASTAKRHAAQMLRTPKWLSAEQLKEIETEYALRQWCSEVMGEEYHVDHIIPLQGKKVSGLHVPWNLRVIPASENIRKLNKFNPEEGMSMPTV